MSGQDVIVSLGALVALLLVGTCFVKVCRWCYVKWSECLDGAAADIP